MAEYWINRLIHCGYSPCNAYRTYHDFLNKYMFSEKELEEFIESLEIGNKRFKEMALCG